MTTSRTALLTAVLLVIGSWFLSSKAYASLSVLKESSAASEMVAVADDPARLSSDTQPPPPNPRGMLVPESFDLSVAGQKFSVHPNATKHMAEYATSTGGGSVPISSLAGAVEQAVAQGLRPGRNFVTIGPWKLGIDTNGNVIYHAVYRP